MGRARRNSRARTVWAPQLAATEYKIEIAVIAAQP